MHVLPLLLHLFTVSVKALLRDHGPALGVGSQRSMCGHGREAHIRYREGGWGPSRLHGTRQCDVMSREESFQYSQRHVLKGTELRYWKGPIEIDVTRSILMHHSGLGEVQYRSAFSVPHPRHAGVAGESSEVDVGALIGRTKLTLHAQPRSASLISRLAMWTSLRDLLF